MSIDVMYHSFSPSRADKGWEDFADDYEKVKSGAKETPHAVYDIVHDIKEGEHEYLTDYFKRLDLEYGSVSRQPGDSGAIEYPLVEMIAKMKRFNFDAGCLTKEQWLQVFQSLNQGFLKKLTKLVAQEMSWQNDEAEDAVMDLLKSVRDVVKDLKEQPDSVYVHEVNQECAPENIDHVLAERAKKHVEQFKSVLV
jgi:hypothetical protein